MKTFKLSGIIAVFIAILAFLPGTADAQCNYRIGNRLNCPVDVKIEIFEPDAQGVCNAVCIAYGMNVPPAAVIPINCGPCNVCNVRVTVVAINGVPVPGPGVSADFSTTTWPGNFIMPIGPPCANPGPSYIFYDPIGQIFYIHP